MTDMAGTTAVWTFTEHEHKELVRGINRVHDIACGIGGWVTPEQSVLVLDVLDWLDRHLEPHIAWEESWLYPEIDARTGTPWATRAARFDHAQIREMAVRLRTDQHLQQQGGGREQLPELRCHLFGIEALLRAHIDREERYLMPILAGDLAGVLPAGTMSGSRAG